MKKIRFAVIILAALLLIAVSAHLCYIYSMTADEQYPADTYLNTVPEKRALIITAHDDDAYSLAGTVLTLIRDGWEVSQVSFKRQKDPENNEVFLRAAAKEGLKEVTLLDIPYRKDTSYDAYMPSPYSNFPNIFNIDTVYASLSEEIERVKPAVIFSLDDVIGGYGHPDHVFISQQVVRYCREHKNSPGFTVQKIYQAVFPPSMAEAILIRNSWVTKNPYILGKKAYNCNGMPLPDVQVNIYAEAKKKKEFMNGFAAHDRKNIDKASPYYNWYPYWIYFRFFDKEYFRVLSFAG